MDSRKRAGFTLIELLVVIAIIGVLTSVVLVSVNTAREKASNAAVKSDLHNITPSAESFYNDNNGYFLNLCVDPKIVMGLEAASTAGSSVTTNYVCNSNEDAWAASAPLKAPDSGGFTYWCVDNSGAAKGLNATLPPNTYSCP